MLLELKGLNGQVELYDDKVIIKRKGVWAKMAQGLTKGDKTIYLSQVSGIDLKPGGNFVNGYIQFTLPGGNEKEKGAFQAIQDENSLMFKKADNDKAIKIKETIEELKQREVTPKTNFSGADEIKKFKELFDDGIITEEEFSKKRKQILGL